jgi:MFS family permease
MRESVFFELRLRRSGVWQVAVWLVAGAAIATVAAWAAAMFDSQPQAGRALVMAIAAGLALATIGLALSLARVEGGLLTCHDGAWAFVPDAGARRTGTLEVAMDLGAFLLLRLVEGRRTKAWLPVQRRGLEPRWHALRCAVYAPPPLAAASPTAPALPSE